jgi:CheY-like chemotaxis protein
VPPGGATGDEIVLRYVRFVVSNLGARYRLLCIASYIKQASTSCVAKTVLIADDSASVRLSVRLLLQGRHSELVVREAVDGIDAIRKAKASQPDLILLDLAMPRLNGAEAAYVLKNDMPETPVILFTMTDLNIGPMCAARMCRCFVPAKLTDFSRTSFRALRKVNSTARIAAAWALVLWLILPCQ